MTDRVAAEIAQRHVEAPWPPYRGRNRAGTQCAFCNRTWPCDAARLLRAAAQADTPTPEQFAEIDRLVAESKAEMAAQADTAPGGGLREAAQALVDSLHGQATGAWNSPDPKAEDFVWYVLGSAVVRLRAALAAPSRDAGLDVERLARALKPAYVEGVLEPLPTWTLPQIAEYVAAEYASPTADGAPSPAGVNRADSEGEG